MKRISRNEVFTRPVAGTLVAFVLACALIAVCRDTKIATADHGTPGQSFLFLQAGFSQEVFGVASVIESILGGVAFAPDGDPLVVQCPFCSNSTMHRYDHQGVAPVVHNTNLHPESLLFSGAGCGLTNNPDGNLYSNTCSGVVRLDADTGVPIGGPFGQAGNGFGITTDPQTGNLVYAGFDGTIRFVDPGFTTSGVFSTQTTGNHIDGMLFDPCGNFLFLANACPCINCFGCEQILFRLTILNRTGALVRHVVMNSQPDGIAFHSTSPKFVVTVNTDRNPDGTNTEGTMTRFDFPGDDFTQIPVQSVFAKGGFRGDLAQVGSDGCLYLTQDQTRYNDGFVDSSKNSLVRICGGFAPPPGVPFPITCPANITRSNDQGQCGANVTYQTPPSSQCGTINCSPASGSPFPVGTTTVTCKEVILTSANQTSTSGNASPVEINAASPCSFTVTITDTQPPPVVCPTQPVVIAAGDSCTALVPDLRSSVTATDNCPGPLSFTQTIPVGTSLGVGSHPAILTVRDAAGNSTDCPVTVTVTGPSSAPVINPTSVNLGTVKLTAITKKKKKKVRATVATGTFTIQNPGCSALTLTLSGIRRVTDKDKFKAPPDDTGFFSVFRQGSEGQGQGLVGTQVMIEPGDTQTFVVRFSPSIPRVTDRTESLSTSDVVPNILVSELFFSEISQTVRFNTGVDSGVKLIDPANPANPNPVVTLCRSGDQFTVIYHIYDSDKTDVKSVNYEFLNNSGKVIKHIDGVDLVGPISRTSLVNGQSFNAEQTFSGAKDNDNVTKVRITVRGGGSNSSAESSGSAGCTGSAQALWKTQVTTVVMPPRRLKRVVR